MNNSCNTNWNYITAQFFPESGPIKPNIITIGNLSNDSQVYQNKIWSATQINLV
jgi:hypothetical protein